MDNKVVTAADGIGYCVVTLSSAHLRKNFSEYSAVDPEWPAEKLLADFPEKWERSFSLWGQPDNVVGYCILSRSDKHGSIHINNLVAHPDQRNRGLGKLLLNEAIDRGARSVKVRTDNVVAIAIYEKAWFKRSGMDNGHILFRLNKD